MSPQPRTGQQLVARSPGLLDWRFLLPDPRLGRVLVSGRVPRRRRRMLAAVAEPAHKVWRSKQSPPGLLDGALAFGLDRAALDRAARWVRPGGWIYVETGPLRWPRRPSSIAGRLSDAGFTDVRLHWHWPSFQSCREMVPLDDPPSVLNSLARRQRGGPSLLLYRAAAGLVHAGVFALLAPDISVVANRKNDP